MELTYDPSVRAAFPDLATVVVQVHALDQRRLRPTDLAPMFARGRALLGDGTESDLIAVRAWRRVFTAMGLRPTQYRCAAEALLRRLRQHGELPTINPLVDLGNAVSVATALPIAAFDVDKVNGGLVVRPATGAERYDTFAGTVEHPEPGEIIFADDVDRAHARRWTHRQSGYSAVTSASTEVMLVVEAQHVGSRPDLDRAAEALVSALRTPATVTFS